MKAVFPIEQPAEIEKRHKQKKKILLLSSIGMALMMASYFVFAQRWETNKKGYENVECVWDDDRDAYEVTIEGKWYTIPTKKATLFFSPTDSCCTKNYAVLAHAQTLLGYAKADYLKALYINCAYRE